MWTEHSSNKGCADYQNDKIANYKGEDKCDRKNGESNKAQPCKPRRFTGFAANFVLNQLASFLGRLVLKVECHDITRVQYA